MKIMERKYICKNGVEERTRFMVGDNTQERKHWRKAKSQQDKREENGRQALRRLARTLNCNADPGWYMVTVNFSDKAMEKLFGGMDPDETLKAAQHQGQLYLRRLKRRAGEVRGVYLASDMDGETGELVRIHLHVVIEGVSEEDVRACWKHGECTDVRHLWAQQDYTPLAAYLVKQVRDVPNMKKYICTQNLDKPQVKDRVLQGDPQSEIRVQPGAKVLDRSPWREGSPVQYVRYIRRPAKEKVGGHKIGTQPQAE